MPSIHTEGYDKEVIRNLFKPDKYDKTISIKIKNDTYDKLFALSRLNNTKISNIVRIAINNLLDNIV